MLVYVNNLSTCYPVFNIRSDETKGMLQMTETNANRDNRTLAELVVRCDMERTLAARLAARGDVEGTRKAEDNADRLHDEMVALARRINMRGNRDACEVTRHANLAHMDTDVTREFHAVAIEKLRKADNDASDPDYIAALDDCHVALDDKIADMHAIYHHIHHAIMTEAPWFSNWAISGDIVREMGAAYFNGTSPLPVTNDDIMDLYENLIEFELCA